MEPWAIPVEMSTLVRLLIQKSIEDRDDLKELGIRCITELNERQKLWEEHQGQRAHDAAVIQQLTAQNHAAEAREQVALLERDAARAQANALRARVEAAEARERAVFAERNRWRQGYEISNGELEATEVALGEAKQEVRDREKTCMDLALGNVMLRSGGCSKCGHDLTCPHCAPTA